MCYIILDEIFHFAYSTAKEESYKHMRFFIALEVPEENRQELKQVQLQVEKLIPEIRLTDNDKFHITLAFIGDQPENLKESLIEVLNHSVEGIAPFEVKPSYIDGFPNIHHPHTIWAGVNGDIDKLLRIRERIKDGLKKLQLPVDERRFTPHIAIAKSLNLQISPETEENLQTLIKNEEPIKVTSIKLFESIPEDGFHKHNTLAEIKLI
jgi:RNA 2',3'-cyclic 3'-phosphodiesterase